MMIALTTVCLLPLVVPITNPVFAGRPVSGTTISIPSLGIHADTFLMDITLQNDEPIWYIAPWEDSVGHLEKTAWLGEGGNIVMGAHTTLPDGSSGIFAHFQDVEIGEEIIISEFGQDFEFRIQEIRIVPYDDTSIVTDKVDRLTLITCSGRYDATIGDFPNRLVVIAVPIQ
jgi:LPXTG-site transpeptidase (sortase) family protein